jgi:hypothetical protein
MSFAMPVKIHCAYKQQIIHPIICKNRQIGAENSQYSSEEDKLLIIRI